MGRSKPTATRRPASAPADQREDVAIAEAISGWFATAARDLPWRRASRARGVLRNPYHALVAEIMLQQTQVSRVIEKFNQFISLFPDVRALAEAPEQDVLSAWTGLGYYRRARNLHAAARQIVADFDGRVPSDPAELRSLKGVGRYTAGAISSIAFGQAAPIVDGNVARVLLRIHGREAASDDKTIQPWLWERAQSLVSAAKNPGAFNEGLMELGATVCVPPPAMPRCEQCPVREHCEAHRAGRELEIPKPRSRSSRKRVLCAVARITRADGSIVVEQRPASGMWANMWQAPTVELSTSETDTAEILDAAKADLARSLNLRASQLKPDGLFEFLATHRHMTFAVFRCAPGSSYAPPRGTFMPIERVRGLALSTPQRRILLGERTGGLI